MATKEDLSNDMVVVNSGSMKEEVPSCCLCLDVRSGTIFFGLCNLVMHAASLAATSRVLFHYHHSPEANIYYHYHSNSVLGNPHVVGFCLAALTFLITLMLVYGAIMRQPNMLLPFFFMQVFDMGLFLMCTAGVVSYGGRLKVALESNTHFAYHHEVGEMSTAHFVLLLTVILGCILIFKAYMLSCVWNCYKHARSHQLNRIRLSPMFFGVSPDHEALLPSYDDIIKESPRQDQTAPPPYSPITAN